MKENDPDVQVVEINGVVFANLGGAVRLVSGRRSKAVEKTRVVPNPDGPQSHPPVDAEFTDPNERDITYIA